MIGGNLKAIIQTRGVVQNDIGEDVNTWSDAKSVAGFLDLISGDSDVITQNAKIQESTHVFLCDYFRPDGIYPENSRMIIDGMAYEVKLIDDPMLLNQHLEIYLNFVGGVGNGEV